MISLRWTVTGTGATERTAEIEVRALRALEIMEANLERERLLNGFAWTPAPADETEDAKLARMAGDLARYHATADQRGLLVWALGIVRGCGLAVREGDAKSEGGAAVAEWCDEHMSPQDIVSLASQMIATRAPTPEQVGKSRVLRR